MEIAFSEKISPQLSAALLSTPYELGKEGGLSKTELGVAARKSMLEKLDKYSLLKMNRLDEQLKSSKR